jgi:hypothetical protein
MPNFNQVNVIVRQMAHAIEMCTLLGLELVNPESALEHGHLEVQTGSDCSLEFDVDATVALWNSGWSQTFEGSVVVGFNVDSRDETVRPGSHPWPASYPTPSRRLLGFALCGHRGPFGQQSWAEQPPR